MKHPHPVDCIRILISLMIARKVGILITNNHRTTITQRTIWKSVHFSFSCLEGTVSVQLILFDVFVLLSGGCGTAQFS